jgi:hypothetical protein
MVLWPEKAGINPTGIIDLIKKISAIMNIKEDNFIILPDYSLF